MGLDQTKSFWQFPPASSVSQNSILIAHDPVMGDVNITIAQLFAMFLQMIPTYNLPLASSAMLGGVKIGQGLAIGSDNKLTVAPNMWEAAGIYIGTEAPLIISFDQWQANGGEGYWAWIDTTNANAPALNYYASVGGALLSGYSFASQGISCLSSGGFVSSGYSSATYNLAGAASITTSSIGGSLFGGTSLSSAGVNCMSAGGNVISGVSNVTYGTISTQSVTTSSVGGAVLSGTSSIHDGLSVSSFGGEVLSGYSSLQNGSMLSSVGGALVGGASVVTTHIGSVSSVTVVSSGGVLVGGASAVTDGTAGADHGSIIQSTAGTYTHTFTSAATVAVNSIKGAGGGGGDLDVWDGSPGDASYIYLNSISYALMACGGGGGDGGGGGTMDNGSPFSGVGGTSALGEAEFWWGARWTAPPDPLHLNAGSGTFGGGSAGGTSTNGASGFAGGLISGSFAVNSGDTITVVIGAGGAAQGSAANNGADGSCSVTW